MRRDGVLVYLSVGKGEGKEGKGNGGLLRHRSRHQQARS